VHSRSPAIVIPPAKVRPLTNGVDAAVAGSNDTTSPPNAPDASSRPSLLNARSTEPNP